MEEQETPRGVVREHDREQMAQKAREALARYGNCAQASFATLEEEYNLGQAVILKALGPFPGGIAARGETCGAVVGSLLSLGLIFGSDKFEDWGMSSLPPAQEFCRLFENEHGSLACRNVLEAKLGRRFDFTNPDDWAQYVSAGGPVVCADIVASAVKLAGTMIATKT